MSFHSACAVATSLLFFFALYTPVVMRAAYFESYRITIGRAAAAGDRAHLRAWMNGNKLGDIICLLLGPLIAVSDRATVLV